MLGTEKLKQVGILAVATLMAFGCSKKSDNRTYDMNTQSIFADGCLNLGKFYETLHNMPADGKVRAFTYNFIPADKDEDGNAPLSARVRVVTRGSYFYSEGAITENFNTWTSASQNGCASGSLADAYGNQQPFTVDEFKDNFITVKFQDGTTQKFVLGDRIMRIYSNEIRLSQCLYDSALKSQSEIVLRWGPGSSFPQSEVLNASYMKSLSDSVPQAPASLRASVADVSTDSISLATSLLLDMNSMQVDPRDKMYCQTGVSAPELPPDSLPHPTPTPAATPDATPAPVATATPAPTPTPTH